LLTLPFDGRFAAVGPLFLPGDTCCYECFRLRRLAGLDYDDEFWALERSTPPSRSAAALDLITAGLAATVALRYVVGAAAAVVGGFHALELGPTIALDFHRVLRVPRCPACSAVSRQAQPLPWFKELPYAAEAA
jgi:bacteriocin biosynthesis cyclodehydratase domain-containing protein